MENKQKYNEKLSTLRDELPFGSINEIARTVECSAATVRRILKGKGYRPDIIEAALRIVRIKKTLIDQIEEAVK